MGLRSRLCYRYKKGAPILLKLLKQSVSSCRHSVFRVRSPDDRKVGIGHGNLAAMFLREETKCFAFLAGHESFAAAEGAIKIAAKATKFVKNLCVVS